MYHVEAKGRRLTRRGERRLARMGFSYRPYPSGGGGKWELSTPDAKEAARAKRTAARLGARVLLYTDAEARSADYRRKFLASHMPGPDGKWACAYCGRRIYTRDMEVDHIIPVRLAQVSPRIRRLMKRWGYDGINDPKNLVPACRRCNRAKGMKAGWWMYRGHYAGTPVGAAMRAAPKVLAAACIFIIIGMMVYFKGLGL